MTRVPFLDLARHVEGIRPELDAAIAEVLDEGRFVGGEIVERFEAEFAAWCGTAHAVGVASGTDAVTIALQAVGIGEGDEVITVANTCIPTVVGIEQTGATPVLVDAEWESMTIDPEQAAGAIGPRTRAIVPVHLYGRCAEMEPILELAREHGLKVVEDCAQAHGATYRGRHAGTMGDAAAFSFYPTKNVGALGDGGAVVTDDAETADAARRFRSYGEAEQYESVTPAGRNSRLDTLQAAILSVKLRYIDDWVGLRRRIAVQYEEAVADAGLTVPGDPQDGTHVFHLYVVRPFDRDAFRRSLLADGVETLVHYPRAVHQHRAYHATDRHGSLACAESLADRVTSLPLYPELRREEIDAVRAAIGRGAG